MNQINIVTDQNLMVHLFFIKVVQPLPICACEIVYFLQPPIVLVNFLQKYSEHQIMNGHHLQEVSSATNGCKCSD